MSAVLTTLPPDQPGEPDPAAQLAAALLDALETLAAAPVGPGVWVGRLSTGHRVLIRRRPQATDGELS